MKKLFVCLMLLCILSAPALRAQNIGNCSIIMYNRVTKENGKINLLGWFSGFNAKAINSDVDFEMMIVFQGYTPDVEHTRKSVITNMKDDSVVREGTPRTFTMKEIPDVVRTFTSWSVKFPEAGNYCITVYVDDLVAQKLYFSVGD